MAVYLARHGETDWNRQGRMQGRRGVRLNEHGRSQAAALACVARTLGIRAIISSPLERAVETAGIVSAAIGCSVTLCEALMEIDFGACTGLIESELEQHHPGLPAARRADKWHHRWPSGESYADAVIRLSRAIAAGVIPGEPDTLLIAHQSVNRALSHLLSHSAPKEMMRMTQPASVVLRFSPDHSMSHATVSGVGEAPLVWNAGPHR